jgi:glutathione S-transferase
MRETAIASSISRQTIRHVQAGRNPFDQYEMWDTNADGATMTAAEHHATASELTLYAHPFSSYCQKVLVALYENNVPFAWQLLDQGHPQALEAWAALWPLQRMPVLVDAGRTVVEASIIIEHLGLYHPGPVRLLPADARAALEVRGMDRFFDNYISTPQQKIVADSLRQPAERDARGVADARRMLDTAYAWLDRTMVNREWAAGDDFSLADCAAAPFLFYADWSHRIDPSFAQVIAYRERLLARPSFARAVDEARPYRALFPLGAPDRD